MDFKSWLIKSAKKSLSLGYTDLQKSEQLGSLLGSDLKLTPNVQSSNEKVPGMHTSCTTKISQEKTNKQKKTPQENF